MTRASVSPSDRNLVDILPDSIGKPIFGAKL
jgi:hypothetical protein